MQDFQENSEKELWNQDLIIFFFLSVKIKVSDISPLCMMLAIIFLFKISFIMLRKGQSIPNVLSCLSRKNLEF